MLSSIAAILALLVLGIRAQSEILSAAEADGSGPSRDPRVSTTGRWQDASATWYTNGHAIVGYQSESSTYRLQFQGTGLSVWAGVNIRGSTSLSIDNGARNTIVGTDYTRTGDMRSVWDVRGLASGSHVLDISFVSGGLILEHFVIYSTDPSTSTTSSAFQTTATNPISIGTGSNAIPATTTAPISAATSSSSTASDHLSVGAIVGGILGGAIALLAIIFGFLYFRLKKKRSTISHDHDHFGGGHHEDHVQVEPRFTGPTYSGVQQHYSRTLPTPTPNAPPSPFTPIGSSPYPSYLGGHSTPQTFPPAVIHADDASSSGPQYLLPAPQSSVAPAQVFSAPIATQFSTGSPHSATPEQSLAAPSGPSTSASVSHVFDRSSMLGSASAEHTMLASQSKPTMVAQDHEHFVSEEPPPVYRLED